MIWKQFANDEEYDEYDENDDDYDDKRRSKQ